MALPPQVVAVRKHYSLFFFFFFLCLDFFLSNRTPNHQHQQCPNSDAAVADSGLLRYTLDGRNCRWRRGPIGTVSLCESDAAAVSVSATAGFCNRSISE